MLVVNEKISIPDSLIQIRFVRSRGPGGQNVNKVNTRAQLTFDLISCYDIPAVAKKRLIVLAGTRMTQEGKLILESDRHRQQIRNRDEVLNRLKLMVRKSLIKPKARIATKPSKASKQKRKDDKIHRSKLKSNRKPVRFDH